MDVAVGQPRDDDCAVDVDGLPRRTELPDLGIAAHRHDLAVGDREGGRGGPLRIEGADARAHDREVDLAHASPLLAREGWTRFGSPGIFGKFGGYGASPAPSASSRSTHSRSLRRSQTVSSIFAWTSPSSANRAGMVASVKSSVSRASSSSQRNGAATVASGRSRTVFA